MKMYHGTTEAVWEEIQSEGVLWGRKDWYWCGHKMDRCTWLAVDKRSAKGWRTDGQYVILEVNGFEPKEGQWQCVVYEPISLDKVRRIE